jgi:protein tyrosine kinase modulator
VVIVVVGLVTLYSGYSYYNLRKTPGALKSSTASITVQIGVNASASKISSNADDLTVSEALADAFANGPILSSHGFDTAVANQINQDASVIAQKYGANPGLGNCNNAGGIGGALSASRVHSLVTITANCATAQGAWAVANAVGEVITTQIGSFLDYAVQSNTASSTINPAQADVSARIINSVSEPVTVPGSASSKVSLYIALELTSLVLGLALVFLLEYLDDRIREKAQATSLLGLPILGVVPRAPAPGRR